MQRRKFYVIGHNPNTLAEAEAFLRAGANALEPDICHDAARPERFYVSHGTIGSNPLTAEHSLAGYLRGVRGMITDDSKGYSLALIAFDIKTPAFDINEFVRFVFDHFSGDPRCDGVAILVTVSSLKHVAFLNAHDQSRERVGVGIDEEGSPRDVEAAFKGGGQRSFSYANGSLFTDVKFGLFKSVMTAKSLQAGGDSFKLVYTWVLSRDSPIRSYLDLHIDGIIVDAGVVPHLLEILREEPFASTYELATNGYDPFNAPHSPAYVLTIKTRDVRFAGTNATVRFTLEGAAGALESSLDAHYADVLEHGETDYLTLEGEDLGEIRSLTVTALTSGVNSEWLPESVTLESRMLAAPVTFDFAPDEWLRFGQSITKTPS
ncbi:MAG: PLAT/LH2 domain-containing protein [Pyrinomonadaceae bacterium]